MITRRRCLRALGLGAIGAAGVVAYTFKIGPHHLTVREIDVPLPRLPAGWDGKRVVHISDLHAGERVDDDYLKACLNTVNELRPDLIAITGDFMDCHDDSQVLRTAGIVDTLDLPERGVVACLGNHDYARNWDHPEVAAKLTGELRSLGISVLRDESMTLDGLELFGCDDLWARGFAPEKTFAALNASRAHLALAHNPDSVDLPGWGAFDGLVLSGHTHGGQCKPPFLPPPLLPVENKRYTKGLFDLSWSSNLHINPGIGHLTKVRFNCRPEITVITLRSIPV